MSSKISFILYVKRHFYIYDLLVFFCSLAYADSNGTYFYFGYVLVDPDIAIFSKITKKTFMKIYFIAYMVTQKKMSLSF